MAAQQQKFQDGEICLDGALSFGESFAFIFIADSKLNSYSDGAPNKLGISEMEQASIDMAKHCVWTDDQGAGMEAFTSGKLGKACMKDTDCKTSLGAEGKNGRCLEAFRAYCPGRCGAEAYTPNAVSSSPMSYSTVKLVANRELAFTTKTQSITRSDPSLKVWKPKCVKNPDYDPAVPEDPADPAVNSPFMPIEWDKEGAAEMSYDCFTDDDAVKVSTFIHTHTCVCVCVCVCMCVFVCVCIHTHT
jgi:hypothetical protein